MVGFWETVEIIAGSSLMLALGISDTTYSVYRVSHWVYKGIDQMIDSNGTRTYKCGICGQEGHNRRTCNENVTCGGCGNEEPDEVWKAEGTTVCNNCV